MDFELETKLKNSTAKQNQAFIASRDPELEKRIDSIAEKLASQEAKKQIQYNKLLPLNALKMQLKKEFENALIMNEIEVSLSQAILILMAEGPRIFDSAIWDKALFDLENGLDRLCHLDIESVPSKTFQSLMGISNETLNMIETIGIQKYSDKAISESSNLFILLCILNPSYFGYWTRLGISYHASMHFAKALDAYDRALSLKPNDILIQLFRVECLYQLSERILVKELCATLKQQIGNEKVPEIWRNYFATLEKAIIKL